MLPNSVISHGLHRKHGRVYSYFVGWVVQKKDQRNLSVFFVLSVAILIGAAEVTK